MKSNIDIIKEELQKFERRYQKVSFRYEYLYDVETHFVEVQPRQLYEDDDNFARDVLNLVKRFEANNPSEMLIFGTDDSLLDINIPDYVTGRIVHSFGLKETLNRAKYKNPVQCDELLVEIYPEAA